MKKITDIINDQFWNLAFKTGFYDFVVMSSYDHSLKTIAEYSEIKENSNIMDVGCGSGRLLMHIKHILRETKSRWTGLELTPGGISACQNRIKNMALDDTACVLPANMCKPLPVDKETIDIAIAHFSFYVIPEREQRVAAFKNISEALKEDGKLLIAIPGKNYNAKDQLISSLALNKQNPDISGLHKLWNKFVFSTFGYFSEITVANRINSGIWCGFTEDEIESEAKDAGLKMQWARTIYGDTSLIAAFSK